jgi:hypothetical protein
VVPVPSDHALTLTADATPEAASADLRRRDLVSWVDEQLLVEGPTNREALIIDALTMQPIESFFYLGHF